MVIDGKERKHLLCAPDGGDRQYICTFQEKNGTSALLENRQLFSVEGREAATVAFTD